ncbi:MAG: sugar phosphate isomerase/epimerase [Gemmataceae bacterium]|nr:sugar phosphate isomerase/epimerase [Gemmataceae bacterium]
MTPSRRDIFHAALAAGTAATLAHGADRPAPKRSKMKKSINLWAFPYPGKWTLRQCLQLAKDAGFDGIELNYDLESDLSPKAGPKEFAAIKTMAADIGIAVSGLCSFLFWPYSLTSNKPAERERGLELAGKMLEAAAELGTPNLLVVPGAVSIPWIKGHDPVALADCDKRAREAVAKMVPRAEKLGVSLNIENIFFNGYLLSPRDMIEFVDSFKSKAVRVHFDTGNIALFQQPTDWIAALGKRIANVHLKEFDRNGTDHSLASFRPLLDGTTDWPAVLAAFDRVGYEGWLTFEYFHPYAHHPEALIHHTSDSLDRLLGRKR